jgi:hypothetical protein
MYHQNVWTAIELGQERQQQILQEAKKHHLITNLYTYAPKRWERWLFTAGNLLIVLGRQLQRRYIATLTAHA